MPKSYRRIGDFLKELELTEGRSTGFPKIRRKLKQNGSPDPLFQTDEQLTYFLTVLYSHPDFTGQDKIFKENATVNATQKKILEEIEKRSSITYDELSELLKKERTTIYRNIKKMVEMNIIKRLGSDKNGYWELNRDMLSAIGYHRQGKK